MSDVTRRGILGALGALVAAPAAVAKALTRDRNCHWPFGDPVCRYNEASRVMIGQPGLTVVACLEDNPGLSWEDFTFPDAPDWNDTVGSKAFDTYYRGVRSSRTAHSGPESFSISVRWPGELPVARTHYERCEDLVCVTFRPHHFDLDQLPPPMLIDCECFGWAGRPWVVTKVGDRPSFDELNEHHEDCRWHRDFKHPNPVALG